MLAYTLHDLHSPLVKELSEALYRKIEKFFNVNFSCHICRIRLYLSLSQQYHHLKRKKQK